MVVYLVNQWLPKLQRLTVIFYGLFKDFNQPQRQTNETVYNYNSCTHLATQPLYHPEHKFPIQDTHTLVAWNAMSKIPLLCKLKELS